MSRGRRQDEEEGGPETESLSEQLSPTDGYFGCRDHPRDMLVPDPSLAESSRSAKARQQQQEDEEERRNAAVSASETSPLLPTHHQSPPAYSATTPSSHRSYTANGYAPVTAAGAPPPPHPLSASVNPQRGYPVSMGNPDGNNPDQAGEEPRWRRSRGHCAGGRFLKKLLFVVASAVFAICALAFGFRAAFRGPQSGSTPDNRKGGHDLSPTGPFCPSATEKLSSDSDRFEFAAHEHFAFHVVTDDNNVVFPMPITVAGEIEIESSDAPTDKIVVELDVRSNLKTLSELVSYEKGAGGLIVKVDVDGAHPHFFTSKPCISIVALISIPRNAQLSELDIRALTLTTRLLSDLQLQLDRLSVSSIAGKLQSSAKLLSARETKVDLISGSITGSYQQLDLLSLKTRSGHVDVSVSPELAEKGRESVPSRFIVETISGQIAAKFPSIPHDVPPRHYHTDVSSTSGQISGDYLLGAAAAFHTVAGQITPVLLPVKTESGSSDLKTGSQSGHLDIEILPGASSRSFPDISSTHHTTSGQVSLHYPSAWKGTMDAHTTAGGINIVGHGVKIDEDKDPWDFFWAVFRSIRAHRGHGASHTSVRTMSGQVKIRLD